MVERTICTEMEADAVIKKKCLPLVGKQQRKYEIMLEDMDVSLLVIAVCNWDTISVKLKKFWNDLKCRLPNIFELDTGSLHLPVCL